MADIGATLREARMRARIDISEVESATKIRAKYLRALENEEWDLLPGPTYVKSFLRTYAEALGLDGKLLIEEYKLGHERLSDVELQPILPHGSRERRRRRTPAVPRGVVVAIVLLALVGALYVLGRGDGDGDEARTGRTAPPRTTPAGQTSTTPAATTPGRRAGASGSSGQQRRRRLARLQITPTGPVYVCLRARGRGTLVDGRILQAGSGRRTWRSSRFQLLLGNGDVRLRVNGRLRRVPAVTDGIAYDITPTRLRRLPTRSRPRCSA